jgi:hypothetical protein
MATKDMTNVQQAIGHLESAKACIMNTTENVARYDKGREMVNSIIRLQELLEKAERRLK